MRPILFVIFCFLSHQLVAHTPPHIHFSGTVTSQNKELSGVLVSVTHLETGQHYAVMTDDKGQFSLPISALDGPYKVRIALLGYETLDVRLTAAALHQKAPFNYELSETQAASSLVGLLAF